MEKLVIEGTEVTPHIECDGDNGSIIFKGRSIPENATSFYSPVMEWLDNYLVKAQNITNLTFELDYLNSISQKMILEILYKFEDFKEQNGSAVNVKWIFEKDDEEIKDEGEIFASRVNLNFEIFEQPE